MTARELIEFIDEHDARDFKLLADGQARQDDWEVEYVEIFEMPVGQNGMENILWLSHSPL